MIPVTVVTATLPERTSLLAECIQSVAAQTHPAAAHLVAVDVNLDGPGPVLNRAIVGAPTEWVCRLDDDDLLDPDYLEVMAAHAADADVVLSWCRIVGKDEPQHRGKFNVFDLANKRDTGMRGNFLFRKSLWEELGGFYAGPGPDWNFLVRCAEWHARFVPVYRELWSYRFHGGNVSDIAAALGRGEQPERLLHLKNYV